MDLTPVAHSQQEEMKKIIKFFLGVQSLQKEFELTDQIVAIQVQIESLRLFDDAPVFIYSPPNSTNPHNSIQLLSSWNIG